jgi:hypothetical protein
LTDSELGSSSPNNDKQPGVKIRNVNRIANALTEDILLL